jgi:DNA-binding MltR family transcriptional regulator
MANYLHPELLELRRFEKELKAESDRGAAIMACTMIDWALERMLKNFLVDSKITLELFEGINGALSSLANKIKMAYSLGLLTKLEYVEFTQLRKIRNEFAHKFEVNFSFSDTKVKSLCDKLEIRETWRGRLVKQPRLVFINSALMMIRSILFRRQLTEYRIKEGENIE